MKYYRTVDNSLILQGERHGDRLVGRCVWYHPSSFGRVFNEAMSKILKDQDINCSAEGYVEISESEALLRMLG